MSKVFIAMVILADQPPEGAEVVGYRKVKHLAAGQIELKGAKGALHIVPESQGAPRFRAHSTDEITSKSSWGAPALPAVTIHGIRMPSKVAHNPIEMDWTNDPNLKLVENTEESLLINRPMLLTEEVVERTCKLVEAANSVQSTQNDLSLLASAFEQVDYYLKSIGPQPQINQ